MNTKTAIIDDLEGCIDKIYEASEIIKNGGLVAFPTETVYGLGADALNDKAVKKIFEAKGRPQDNPLIIHVASKDINKYVKEIPLVAKKLMDSFWPGPLTIILNKKSIVPDVTSAGLDSIGIRMPNNKIALKLIELSGTVIAAPSANISGRPSPTDYERCVEDLDGKVDYILGGKESDIGVESTIVDCTSMPPLVLRPGGITLEMLREVDDLIDIDPGVMKKPSDSLKPKAPGMKYRHYAPNAQVTIVRGENELVVEKINNICNEYIKKDKKVCILTVDENLSRYTNGVVLSLGKRKKLDTVAKNLFETLRKCDDLKADYILSESFDEKGVGIAIMNRLNKAAGFNIINI